MRKSERIESGGHVPWQRLSGEREAPDNGLLPAGVFVLFLLASCADPIVGAECEPGFQLCDGRCVSLSSFEHCGRCNNDCGSFLCIDGECSTILRGDAGDIETDAGPPDGSLPVDSGLSGCPLGQLSCGGSCVRVDVDRNHCGDCDNQCRPNEFCVLGVCEEACEDPLVLCGGLCVDIESDPANCGRCGHECVSWICESGKCADVTAGHLVVVGHDFVASGPVMQRMAGNAVFLARGSPVRVLVYEGEASSTSITGTDGAIDFVAEADGRSWEREVCIEGLVTHQLGNADVFVIYAQQQAGDSVLRKLGEQWGNALSGFLRRGGVVVSFETLTDNAGTFQVLQPAQIFSAEAIAAAAGNTLTVTDPSDQVALGVPRRFITGGPAIRFQSVSTPANVVAEDEEGAPVILHRVVMP
jgi:hypothetical protein